MAAAVSSFLLLLACLVHGGYALSVDYYSETCPHVEAAVAAAVEKAMANDNTAAAALLRLHFHDCFVRGCDASVLLDSTEKSKAEKDGPPNASLHAFYVVDSAKKAVEAMCPGVVSCADVLALAARDVVHLSGGPTWEVPKGRLDGRISNANDSLQLPFPVGGHTLGFSHCSSFRNRIHNFNATHDFDPTLNPSFIASLRSICPAHNNSKNAGTTMDSTGTVFDNMYFKLLLQGKSLFSSDQALLSNPKSKDLVLKFAQSNDDFNEAFVKSMIRMGSIRGGQEVRLNCRVVN